ncbi:C-type lectin mannose-binding isoform-like [Haliotis rufescens]|uniref:C-type lectin mannose-binding isoform-like n=1 Tax=Haliotis rufescens TaxID=6454 RepID=UPI00201E9CF5|nr:C-type lectin mannose-binding isoform-like [Haliotis rufescens]
MHPQLLLVFFVSSVSCQKEGFTVNEEQDAVLQSDDNIDDLALDVSQLDFGVPYNENFEERLVKLEDLVENMQKTCSRSCTGSQETAVCPEDFIWNKALKFCYKIHADDKLKWATAQLVCAAEVPGGRLAIFDTDEKRQAVYKNIQDGTGKPQNYFVGARRTHGDFQWTDGTTMTNVKWCDGEPNGTKCGSMWARKDYCMDDVSCSWNQGFVCEKPMK